MSGVKRQDHPAAAIELFGQALVLDPDCVNAMIGIALARIYQVINLYRPIRKWGSTSYISGNTGSG